MKRLYLTFFLGISLLSLKAQQTVSIGTSQTNNKAVLWLNSAGQNQGLIIPVVSNTTAVGASGTADRGMIVYNQTDNKVYYFNGTIWVEVGASGGTLTADNTSIEIAGGVLRVKDAGITDAKIAGVTPAKIAQAGATTGQVLKWNGSAWVPQADAGTAYTAGTGISIVGTTITNTGDTNAADDLTATTAATGDLAGTFGTPTVDGIQGRAVANTVPADQQVLKWSQTNSRWEPANDAGGTTYTPGTGISIAAGVITNTGDTNGADDITTSTTSGGDIAGTFSAVTVDGLQGRAVANTAPTDQQVLKWNQTLLRWEPANDAGGTTYTAGTGISIAGGIITNTGDTNAADDITTATTATGDLTGTFGTPTVNRIQTRAVAATAPADQQVLKWNQTNNQWEPSNDAGGTAHTAGPGISIVGSTIGITPNGVTGTQLQSDASVNANRAVTSNHIQDNAVTDAKILNLGLTKLQQGGAVPNQVLEWNGTNWAPATDDVGIFNPMSQDGDMIYGGAGGIPTRLPGAIGILKNNGTVPSWAALIDADVSISAAIAGTKITPAFGAQNISTTGTLSTGDITTTNIASVNGVPYTWTNAQGAANSVLTNNGSGGLSWAPAASSFSTINTIPRGDGAGLVASSFYDDGAYTAIGRTTQVYPNARFEIESTVASGPGGMLIHTPSGSASPYYGYAITNTLRAATYFNSLTNAWTLYNGATDAFSIGPAGEVGLNTNYGTTGQVLTSNGTGTAASWTTISSSGFSTANEVPRGNGSGLVSSNIFSNGTNVGVGAAPLSTYQMEVNKTLAGLTDAHIRTYNPSSGIGVKSGVRFETGGGWAVHLQTSYSGDWLQLTDNGGTPVHRWGYQTFYPSTSGSGYIQGTATTLALMGGNVGIGTIGATSALEVVGNVEIPAANNYTYSAAKTHYLAVNHAAFEMGGTNAAVTIHRSLNNGNPVLVRTQGGTLGTVATLSAPIYLPDGATITELTGYVFDSDATYDATVRLMRQSLANFSNLTLATVTSTGAPSQAAYSTTTISNPVVDNANFAYAIVFVTTEANTALGLYNVRITYTVTNAD